MTKQNNLFEGLNNPLILSSKNPLILYSGSWCLQLLTSYPTRNRIVQRPFSLSSVRQKKVSKDDRQPPISLHAEDQKDKGLRSIYGRVKDYVLGADNRVKPFTNLNLTGSKDSNLRWISQGIQNPKWQPLEKVKPRSITAILDEEDRLVNRRIRPGFTSPRHQTTEDLATPESDKKLIFELSNKSLSKATLDYLQSTLPLDDPASASPKVKEPWDWSPVEVVKSLTGWQLRIFEHNDLNPSLNSRSRLIWTLWQGSVLQTAGQVPPITAHVVSYVGWYSSSNKPKYAKAKAYPGETGRWLLRPERTCLKLLPNLRRMEVIKGLAITNLLRLFGVSWKEQTGTRLWGWRNRKYNKYMKAQYARLHKARGDKSNLLSSYLSPIDGKPMYGAEKGRKVNSTYWHLSYFLLQRSTIFRTIYFNHAFGRWEKAMRFDVVLDILGKVEKLVRTGNWTKLALTRVWIGEGKRPLGVPGGAHRVVGAQMSALLEFYISGTIQHNHAYQHKRGTGTAWEQILNHLLRVGGAEGGWPSIYEYDISGFFNNVSHRRICEVLKQIGCPSWFWLGILQLQQCAPGLENDKTPEAQAKSRNDFFQSYIAPKGPLGAAKCRRSETGGPSVGIREDSSKNSNKKFLYEGHWNRQGVAQGHNLSPLLSILVLDLALQSFTRQNKIRGYATEVVQYADDGVIGMTDPEAIDIFPDILKDVTGCSISWEKSGWVRYCWDWKTKLKFLGLLYDPFTSQLFAATRKGSKIRLDQSKSEIYLNWNLKLWPAALSSSGSDRTRHLLAVKDEFILYEPYSLGETRLDHVGYFQTTDEIPQLPNQTLGYRLMFLLGFGLFSLLGFSTGSIKGYVLGAIGLLLFLSQLYEPKRDPDYPGPYLLRIGEGRYRAYHNPTRLAVAKSLSEIRRFLFSVTIETQQITWRSVVRAGKLNTFMARLYYGSLKNYKPKQDFRLDPLVGSLIDQLRSLQFKIPFPRFDKAASQLEPQTTGTMSSWFESVWGRNSWGDAGKWLQEKFWWTDKSGSRTTTTNPKAPRSSSYVQTVYRRIEADLGTKISTFNSSTVGTHLLPDVLKEMRREGITSNPPLPPFLTSKKLFKKFMSRMHVDGYWSVSPGQDGHWSVFDGEYEVLDTVQTLNHPVYPKVKNTDNHKVILANHHCCARKLAKSGIQTERLHTLIDWTDLFLIDRWNSLAGDRFRRLYAYLSTEPLYASRTYKMYRLQAIKYRDQFWGWVPIRPKKNTDGVPQNNPISMTEMGYLGGYPDRENRYLVKYVNGRLWRPSRYGQTLKRAKKAKVPPIVTDASTQSTPDGLDLKPSLLSTNDSLRAEWKLDAPQPTPTTNRPDKAGATPDRLSLLGMQPRAYDVSRHLNQADAPRRGGKIRLPSDSNLNYLNIDPQLPPTGASTESDSVVTSVSIPGETSPLSGLRGIASNLKEGSPPKPDWSMLPPELVAQLAELQARLAASAIGQVGHPPSEAAPWQGAASDPNWVPPNSPDSIQSPIEEPSPAEKLKAFTAAGGGGVKAPTPEATGTPVSKPVRKSLFEDKYELNADGVYVLKK